MRLTPVLPLVVVTLSGCVGVGTMKSLAPDAGVEVRYAVPADTVRHALPGALQQRGLRIAAEERFDSLRTMVIAEKGIGLFAYGALVRVLVSSAGAGTQATARFAVRSHSALDWSGYAGRWRPRAIAALDARLEPAALGPFPGMDVRGRTGDGNGPLVRGTVTAAADGSLQFRSRAAPTDPPIPVATLHDLAVFRGAYTHRSEGANIGAFVGMVAGVVIAATTSDDADRRNAVAWGIIIGSAAGTFTGALTGSLIRSEVWSTGGR
jgi:hypothetical protein